MLFNIFIIRTKNWKIAKNLNNKTSNLPEFCFWKEKLLPGSPWPPPVFPTQISLTCAAAMGPSREQPEHSYRYIIPWLDIIENYSLNGCSSKIENFRLFSGNCLVYCLMSSKFQKEGIKQITFIYDLTKSSIERLVHFFLHLCRRNGSQQPASDQGQQIEIKITSVS